MPNSSLEDIAEEEKLGIGEREGGGEEKDGAADSELIFLGDDE